MNINLKSLQDELRAIGRAVALVSDTAWKPGDKLSLTHLGDTEGDITVAFNESLVHMTLPEVTGPAKHESFVEGEDPVVTLPLFVADPALREILSPTGNASGGNSRRQRVKTRTLVLMPEELFFDGEAYTGLTYTAAGGWKMGANPLTEDQERLLGLSMFFWRGYFTRPGVSFKHGDAGKVVESVSFQVMQSPFMPEGNQLYTLGDPEAAGIDIDPTPGD